MRGELPADEPGNGPGPAAVDVLAELPAALWPELLRAFRRAADQQPRGTLPAAVRPFAGWKPDALLAARPRRAVAEALVHDAALREAVADQLLQPDQREAADVSDPDTLVAGHGGPMAAALLAVGQRWEDLARMSARTVDRTDRRRREAEVARARREWRTAEEARVRLAGDLAYVRSQREEGRRRAVEAEARADSAEARLAEASAEVSRLRGEVRRFEEAFAKERDRAVRKIRGARARAERAESRARVEEQRARTLALEVESLKGALRDALQPPAPPRAVPPPVLDRPVVPRAIPAALPGRPCKLPMGLTTERAEGVLSLLQCVGLTLIIDGYNVTKHVRGMPRGTLGEQRRWLVGVAGGVAARFRVRVTVAFDGAEVGGTPGPSARGVQVAFSRPGETADDLIVALLESRPPTQPSMVVTDDRELRGRIAERDADTAGVAPFLDAVGA